MIDIPQAGVTLAGIVVTVAVVKNDLKWLKEWMKEHKHQHEIKDLEVSQRLRKLEIGE